MSDTKKTYAPSFGFWPAKSGNGFTTVINAKLIEDLKANLGGTLLLSAVPTEKIEENAKFPHYRVVVFAPREKQAETNDSI